MTNRCPQIICFEAIMMILTILCNFTVLGVGVRVMDMNKNVSIRMHLVYILHFLENAEVQQKKL